MFAAIEESLGMWFAGMQAKKAIMTDHILLEKAKFFTERLNCRDFTASEGWLSRFKCRHGIFLRRLHGEADSVDITSISDHRI